MQTDDFNQHITRENIRILLRLPPAEIQELLIDFVSALPEPRVYVLEPEFPPDTVSSFIWTAGRDVLGCQLQERGMSVVDPDAIHSLVSFSKLARASLTEFNPLLGQLFTRGHVLHGIYIPELKAARVNTKMLRGFAHLAHKHRVRVHYWEPLVQEVLLPPRQQPC